MKKSSSRALKLKGYYGTLEKRFQIVTLDFSGIRLVGQGFVDEVFRVYKNQHPDVIFKYINASKDVEFMIKRGISIAN